jgi:hypothetical protein
LKGFQEIRMGLDVTLKLVSVVKDEIPGLIFPLTATWKETRPLAVTRFL